FVDHRLVDLADSFVKQRGKYLFIDEIHKYKEIAHQHCSNKIGDILMLHG
ncbi:AAA family ATPase, partial [Bacteroides sp. 51]|nr:AAA family ATPase [Bacteroides sp. 51]